MEQDPFKEYLKESEADKVSSWIAEILPETAFSFSPNAYISIWGVFGRSAVMELLELKSVDASKLISKLLQAEVIEPISCRGKGKYQFKERWGFVLTATGKLPDTGQNTFYR